MKLIQILLAVCIAILLADEFSTAKMYKYVDENGVVNYQDYPPENIAPDTEVETFSTIKSKKGELPHKKNKVSKKTGEISNVDPSQKAKPAKTDYSKARVELYVTSWCKYCKKAENFFRSKGIAYTAYDIEKDKAAAQRKDKLSPKKGVPFAVVNGQHIYGFSPSAYENALNNF